MTTDTDIGRRVRAARERIDITQADLGRRMAWARTTVAGVEAGKRAVLARELVALARALETGVWELLGQRV
jgi:transcriptional regulator with XRE-family HTH domain